MPNKIKFPFPIIKTKIDNIQINWKDICFYRKRDIENILSHSVMCCCFDDNIENCKFIFEIVNIIEKWIHFNTNIMLINNNQAPLTACEDINIVMNGSKLMDFVMNGNFVKERRNSIRGPVSGLFETTDFGYLIQIKTRSSNRFEIIEKFCIESLYEILSIVSELLDQLISGHTFSFPNKFVMMDDRLLSIDNKSQSNNLRILKKIIEEPHFSFTKDIYDKKINPKEMQERNKILLIDMEKILNLIQRENISILSYPYFTFFNMNTDEITFDCINNNLIYRLVKLFSRKSKHFYDLNDIRDNFINRIERHKIKSYYSFNHVFEHKYENLINTDFYEKHDLHDNNMNLWKDFDKYFGNNRMMSFGENKYHTIIINQNMAFATHHDTLVRDFDIVELKLNFCINDDKLSSELISFRIPRFESSDYKKLVNCENRFMTIENSKIKIISKTDFLDNIISRFFSNMHFDPSERSGWEYELTLIMSLIKDTFGHEFNRIKNILKDPETINYKNNLMKNYFNSSIVDYIRIKEEYTPALGIIFKFILFAHELQKLDPLTQKVLMDSQSHNYKVRYDFHRSDFSKIINKMKVLTS